LSEVLTMTTQSTRTPPGPRGVPLFGNVIGAWRDPIGLIMSSWREYGDVVKFKFGPFDYLFLNDPDAIHHVLVDNAKNYTKSRNYQGLKLVLGEGLVTSERETWKRQRKLVQPAFHRERLAGFAGAMVMDTTSMLERWATRGPEAFDVHEEMMRLTFRIVGRTLFSTDVEADADRIGPAVSAAMHYANDYAESIVRMPQWLPTPANIRFKKVMRTLDDLVLRIVAERRATKGTAQPNDLLTMLMEAHDDETHDAMSDRQLRDEVMTIILAGHETTANLLTWTWFLLSSHPDVERRMHDEIANVLGDRAPTLDDLPKLKLVKMVIEESLRLYPPAWAFERQAVADDTIAGYPVRAKTIIGMTPYALHRHPRYWENPEGFDPERFTPERSEGRPRYAYLPFGGGPRFCIGNGFAMMEAQILVAMIAQRHRLQLVPGHPIVLDPTVTLRPKHGVKVTIERQRATRSDAFPTAMPPLAAAPATMTLTT
jgi:cytochrome P450